MKSNISLYVRFTVLTAQSIKSMVFRDVTQHSLGDRDQNIGRICCIHLYGRRMKKGGCRFLWNIGTCAPNRMA
jgi:hypothetical protein